jgi:Uma2 family endonuclease
MATKTLLTIADFDALDEIEGVKQELIDGELVVTPSPMPRHNIVCSKLGVPLGLFVTQHKLGIVLWGQDYQVGDDVLNPDLAFIRAERLIEKNRRPGWAPDLVVEIWSPSNERKSQDLRRKAKRYLDGGAQAVWLLYPEAGIARIERPGQPSQVLDVESGGKLEDRALLPGFSIALADIFE